ATEHAHTTGGNGWTPGTITPSAWHQPDPDSESLVSRGPKPTTPARIGPPGGGGGAAGGFGQLAGQLEATPELLAKVAALDPIDTNSGVDLDAAAAPDPHFKFGRFLRAFRV